MKEKRGPRGPRGYPGYPGYPGGVGPKGPSGPQGEHGRDGIFITWRAFLLGYIVPLGLVTVGLVFGLVRLDNETAANKHQLERIEELRKQRVFDTSRSDFETCRRDNFQDRRDRSQDRLLLELVTVALDPELPDEKQTKVFEEVRQILIDRANEPHPVPPFGMEDKDGKGIDENPRDCYSLASQRPFESSE